MRTILLTLLFVAQASWAGERVSSGDAERNRASPGPKEVNITRLSNINYGLTREQVDDLSKQAMSGDASAALRLAQRYFFDVNKQGEVRNNALKWSLIGAENGSAEAQFLAYSLMEEETDLLKQMRALYWLKRSAESGYEDAVIIYKNCHSIDSKYSSGSPCFGPDE